MAYAGRQPTTGFRSTPTKDSFNGDNSTTEFTLSISTRTNDVEVFVENVQQEPVTAYSISGNTLTFTSAPPTGTGNIYVIHRAELVSNGVHTPGANLEGGVTTLDSLTVTGDVNVDSGTIKLDGNYPTGTSNVALGDDALSALTTGSRNTAIGEDALSLNTTGSNNTGVGKNAIKKNVSGSSNTAVGDGALVDNTASNNTAVGSSALLANTTGANNVAIGAGAADSQTSASNNVAIGRLALSAATTGNETVAIGSNAGQSITDGVRNTVCGTYALSSLTTGDRNTVVGYDAGNSLTTPNDNTFIGSGSGGSITTGSKNTIIGKYTGNQGGLDIRTSSNNIVLSDGDGNPRVHINSTGVITHDAKVSNFAIDQFGFAVEPNGGFMCNTSNNQRALLLNRQGSDGDVIEIRQANSKEGTISVSGSTVSYNGGHLSRWSRLADDSKDTSIVKGTVMTNLDAMVAWSHDEVLWTADDELPDGVSVGDVRTAAYTEDNEQLNKMAVSSVEGDANVAGVFVNWDDDDDFNDMNIAMTGDFVIRIAQGTTVARGDLLMSAGDGTAKPQGDDIVRSKTIAKVTSTHVSHTYDDGSYLVPCVLMAC